MNAAPRRNDLDSGEARSGRERGTRWRATVLLALTAVAGLPAQPPRFEDRLTVVAVDVPVHVTVDGRPVSGLGSDDFEVVVGRRKQPVTGFDVVDLGVAARDAGRLRAIDPALPPAARRYFMLLFDLTHSDPAALVRARRAAQQLVAESFLATDLVAVTTWSVSGGAALRLGFTSDRSQVEAALETLGLAGASTNADPLGILLADIERSSPTTTPWRREPPASASIEAEADRALLAGLNELAARERSALQGERATEAVAFSRSLAAVARLLTSIQGRKQVILLSQGFDSGLLHGALDAAEEERVAGAAATGEIWEVDSTARFGDARIGSALAQAVAELRRADCAIQAVDIGGLAAATPAGATPQSNGRGTLLTLARDTGGELYANFNRLSEALSRLLESTRVTYVLTIAPQGLIADGRYHELKVRVRGGPSRTRVRHRHGFFAPRAYELRPEIDRRIDDAQLLLAGLPGGELDGGVVAPVFRAAGGRAHVPVVVEVDGRALLAEGRPREPLRVAVYTYAFDAAGGVRDFAAQRVELEPGEVEGRLRREPLKMVGDLLLAPGQYTLRTLVRAGERGRHFLAHTELVVPAADAGALQVVAALAAEPMSRGLVVRLSARRGGDREPPFPFVARGGYFLPSGRPRLVPERPLELALQVYGLESGSAEIRGELVDAGGRHRSDVAIFVTADEHDAGGDLRRFTLSAVVGEMPPGAWALRLTVHQGARSAAADSPVMVER